MSQFSNNSDMRRVLITGAQGLVGSSLLQTFLDRNNLLTKSCEFYSFSRSPNLSHLSIPASVLCVENIIGDCSSSDSWTNAPHCKT